MPDELSSIIASDTVESYRVEPDIGTGGDSSGDWHVITFVSGRQVQIYSTVPVVIVDPETH